jgi:hypothetical protein
MFIEKKIHLSEEVENVTLTGISHFVPAAIFGTKILAIFGKKIEIINY